MMPEAVPTAALAIELLPKATLLSEFTTALLPKAMASVASAVACLPMAIALSVLTPVVGPAR